LVSHYAGTGTELNEARLRMARIPEGATLIENSVSSAPGFTLKNVHVMAGVPMVFKAMVASLLPTLSGGKPLLSQTLRLELPEGVIAKPLAELAADFPELRFGSYPFYSDEKYGTNIVGRGTDISIFNTAMAQLAAMFASEDT
ncbi:molybdopterin-binding protein, partial [Marinosulfonomonas sp. PRT-SC04]